MLLPKLLKLIISENKDSIFYHISLKDNSFSATEVPQKHVLVCVVILNCLLSVFFSTVYWCIIHALLEKQINQKLNKQVKKMDDS